MPKRTGRGSELWDFLLSDGNLGMAIDEVNESHHFSGKHKPNSCTAWVQETKEERIRELTPYQVNQAVMENAKESAVFMHCLPAFHDLKTTIGQQIHQKFGLTEMEVTDEVFEGSQSVVFDEAENRMHSIKAIMYATL